MVPFGKDGRGWALFRNLNLADGFLAFGFLLQAQRLDLVGVGAELGGDLGLGFEHEVVEIPLGSGDGVTGGGQGVGGVDFGVLGGQHGVEAFGGFGLGKVGVGGGVAAHGLQGGVGIVVGLEDDGTDADRLIVCHFFSFLVGELRLDRRRAPPDVTPSSRIALQSAHDLM